MKKTIVPLLVILVMFPSITLSEVNPAPLKSVNGLGISAGMVGGLGFSYRYFPREGMGLHTSIIYFGSGENHFFDMAIEPIIMIHNSGRSAVYAVLGAAIFASEGESSVAGGFGLGIAWRRFGWWPKEQIWTSAELVMTAYKGWFYPIPQFGLHYMF